ncbi:MAG: SpoIIE family protein phosphatase [Bacteroidota bacterium]
MPQGVTLHIKNWISRFNPEQTNGSIEERMQREIFVFIYFIFSIFALSSIVFFFYLEKTQAAVLPISYILIAGLSVVLISKNIHRVFGQRLFNVCTLLLPFVLQYFLGGIKATGFLMIWSSISILNVISLKDNRKVMIWCLCFLGLIIHSFEIEHGQIEAFENSYSKNFLAMNFALVAFIHFGLSRYVIFHQIRLRKVLMRNQEKLELINENLSYRNTEINDSLVYAQHLQSSILPKSEILSERFQEFEIFFKPKEVIGGDFYWYGEIEGKRVFAIIDCTGHGIPGAFVSMMGYNLLNHIILSKRITYPGFILNQLNQMVKQSLHQESSGNKDGMDMSIITYDPISRSLEFAGAKNDLFYLDSRNGLVRLKGSRSSIGGFNGTGKAEYETHEITLRNKTKFFMTTDGLIDQFGGENNKRFSTKRLTNFLKLMIDREVKQINKDLIFVLNEWQGNNEQLDDILFSTFSIDPVLEINRTLKYKSYHKKSKRA